MPALLDRNARIALAQAALDEGRIVPNLWRKPRRGVERVCPLAAFGPDIGAVGDVPPDLMPNWLAGLVPVLADGVAADDVAWFAGELIARAGRWDVLGAGAWQRVRLAADAAAVEARTAANGWVPDRAIPVAADTAAAAWAATGFAPEALAVAETAAQLWADEQWNSARWAAAYRQLADALFAAIDAEIEALGIS